VSETSEDDGIDVNCLEVGDVVGRTWDRDTREEDSCHCDFRAIVAWVDARPMAEGRRTVEVISHDLMAGDIIRGKEDNPVSGDCHCDYIFTVER
jgi:hypothetical protein